MAAAVEARLAELRMDRTALAKRAEVDRKTVDNFLDRGMKPRTDKRGGYENAIGWGYGSMLVVARGGEPDVWPLDYGDRLKERERRLQADMAEENSRGEGEIDRPSVGGESEGPSYVPGVETSAPPATDPELLAEIAEATKRLAALVEKMVDRDRPSP